MSVQLLLPGTGSITPGGVTVAVLASGLPASADGQRQLEAGVPPVASGPVVKWTVFVGVVGAFVAETKVVCGWQLIADGVAVTLLGPLLVTVIV